MKYVSFIPFLKFAFLSKNIITILKRYSMLELHEFAILFIKGAQHEDENFFTSSEKTL